MVGTNRFSHVYHLSTGLQDSNQLDQWDEQFQNQYQRADYNHEQNFINLDAVIRTLSDEKRNQLFELCGTLLGCKLELKRVDETRELSPRYVDMDGQNLSVGSTGTRLLITLMGICIDDRFDTILIDEPELGLSPKVQLILSDFIQNPESRRIHFPHLKQIMISTHSHLFLDRREIANNFIVNKTGSNITLEQVKDLGELHRLQFNLLGNSLEAMYFPSAIVIVEGITDFKYVERLIALKHPKKRIAVVSAQGDIKRKAYGIKEVLGDFSTSPFADRIFVILDSTISNPSLIQELVKMGISAENVIKWDKNGIEYFYPPSILASIFRCDECRIHDLTIKDDDVSMNGITKRKNELCDEVIKMMTAETILPDELEERFLKPLNRKIS